MAPPYQELEPPAIPGRFSSASTDAIWPAQSLTCQRGGKLQLCYGATASRSPQHLFPTMLMQEEVPLLHASNEGWQPMASFPLRLRLQIYTFERYSEYVTTALNALRGPFWVGGDKTDRLDSFDSHPQTIVLL